MQGIILNILYACSTLQLHDLSRRELYDGHVVIMKSVAVGLNALYALWAFLSLKETTGELQVIHDIQAMQPYRCGLVLSHSIRV